jgi:hypothetical protein
MEKCLLRYKRKFKASSLQTRTISGTQCCALDKLRTCTYNSYDFFGVHCCYKYKIQKQSQHQVVNFIPKLVLVCNEDVHHMRLQRIINIPLQITKKSVNIAVNKIKPLNGKHHEGI